MEKAAKGLTYQGIINVSGNNAITFGKSNTAQSRPTIALLHATFHYLCSQRIIDLDFLVLLGTRALSYIFMGDTPQIWNKQTFACEIELTVRFQMDF